MSPTWNCATCNQSIKSKLNPGSYVDQMMKLQSLRPNKKFHFNDLITVRLTLWHSKMTLSLEARLQWNCTGGLTEGFQLCQKAHKNDEQYGAPPKVAVSQTEPAEAIAQQDTTQNRIAWFHLVLRNFNIEFRNDFSSNRLSMLKSSCWCIRLLYCRHYWVLVHTAARM